jgi:hypothetical protein
MEMGQPETAAYEATVAKKPLDLAGSGICRYVEIFGDSLQKQVADTSPYQVGDKAFSMESVERAHSIRAYLLSRYAVILPGNDSWFHAIYHIILYGKSKLALKYYYNCINESYFDIV